MGIWLRSSLLACASASAFTVSSACVSNEHSFSDKVELVAVVGTDSVSAGKYTLDQGTHTTADGHKVQWFTCAQDTGAADFVLLNPPEAAFQASTVCQYPVATEILQHGFNVVALNRPGQGESSGLDLLGADQEVSSSRSVLEHLRKQGQIKQFKGLWAYGEASIHAFRLAKQLGFTYLIIGNGIYDWEATLKEGTDTNFTGYLRRLQGSDAASAKFAEQRSIAWDLAGLPPNIFLYHNQGNPRVLANQASAFKTSLAASEYRVELLMLDQEGWQLPSALHRGLIKKVLSKFEELKPKAP